MRIPLAPWLLTCVLAPAIVAAQTERHHAGGHGSGLGTVEFTNSGARSAQEPFLRGLALLHSFEYDEAAEAFREAQKADAGFALAYYGEALTYAHLLWGQDQPALARQALSRLAATPALRIARAPNARERAYAAAIEALYIEADLATRVRAFADSTSALMRSYPQDVDAAAFASLALLFKEYVGELNPEDRRVARDRAIAIADAIFQSHPKHPGGTHYLIHATDDPAFAARGLDAARSYAQLAPEAEHALHMPSHIFLQLGQWDDVVTANERAWAASRAEVVARKLHNTNLSFHALTWLHYGYLQQGRYAAARAAIDSARAVLAGIDLSQGNDQDARYVINNLEFSQAAETGVWGSALCAAARDFRLPGSANSAREQSFQNAEAYQAVVTSVQCGQSDHPLLALVRGYRAEASGDVRIAAYRNAIVHADALLALRRGDRAAAIALLEPAAAAPARPPVGPPGGLRTHELLGAALLEAGRPAEAARAYERALQLTPLRSSALIGLARARGAAGDAAGGQKAYRELLSKWKRVDPGIAALTEAQRALRK